MRKLFTKLGFTGFVKRGDALSPGETASQVRRSRYMSREEESLFFNSGRRPAKAADATPELSPSDLYRSGQSPREF